METINTASLSKDWSKYPKFRHNLWTTYDDEPDSTYLVVSHSRFEVPRAEAETFLRMRQYCTGHHTVEEIAQESGVELERVCAILDSLSEGGVFRPPYQPLATLTAEEIRARFSDACRIWSEQLEETYVAAEIQAGKVPKSVLLGWLLETYHYIRRFPEAIDHAARHASGELRDILAEYAEQERGHEAYVLRCLLNLDFERSEVDDSLPLVSTRLIDFQLRELFADAPQAALLLAAIVEADHPEEGEADSFRLKVAEHYGLPEDALQPLQDHMIVDAELGHVHLADRFPHLIEFRDETQIHSVANQLHDIKHAFDLQSLEIKSYYTHTGNYVPRQFVDFFSI